MVGIIGKIILSRRRGVRSGARIIHEVQLRTSTTLTAVIVADDDPLIRSVLRSKLEMLDLTVFVASDGSEAVAFASRIQASLILLDLKMPLLNGLLACERIRRQPGNAHTPIVILTSAHGNDAANAATRVGASAFLTKPFRLAPLMEVLTRFLPMTEAMRTAIHRDAARANEIAHAAPMTGNRLVKPGSDNVLDRGKSILDVLRG